MKMELIIPFRKSDYSDDGTHLLSDRFILEVQHDWEELFFNKFKPFYANALEGHPSAMLRLTRYMEAGEETDYDFGMDLIDGEIDIDTNLKIEKFSKVHTVYAIGSRFHENEDEPLLLLKNDSLKEDILVIKYVPDDDGEENETENIPVDAVFMNK
jgi:hypothetical protein